MSNWASVDLVYDVDCPNVSLARANLAQAFALAGIAPKWFEHRIGEPGFPEHARGYGSPTVLIGGRDVAGLGPSTAVCCRIYTTNTGLARAPTVEQIVKAMSSAKLSGT